MNTLILAPYGNTGKEANEIELYSFNLCKDVDVEVKRQQRSCDYELFMEKVEVG